MKYVYTNHIVNMYKTDPEARACFSLMTGLIDRTNSVQSRHKYITDPIATQTTSRTLESIGCEVAEKIKARKKPVYVFWSGGIDSTLVLAYLKKVNTPNVTICSYQQERLDIFKGTEFKTLYFPVDMFLKQLKKCLTYGIVVTGEFGDQIFGSSILSLRLLLDNRDMFLLEANNKNLNWLLARFMMGGSRREDSIVQEAKEFLAPIIANAPFEIRTCHDYFWWINYTCKWNTVQYRLYDGQEVYNMENLCHFYSDMEYQKWAITEENQRNHKYKDGVYKHTMLEQIDKLGFDSYLIDRVKIGSLDFTSSKLTLYIDENGRSEFVGRPLINEEVVQKAGKM